MNFRLVFALVGEYAFRAMTPRGKIDLEKVRACLNKICSLCGYTITPPEIMRLDFERMRCPKCGGVFAPVPKK